MELAIISAVSSNGVIGLNNRMPWSLPEDLAHFKDRTMNHPVIMGRKTFESINEALGGPLPKRENIVLSSCGQTLGEDIYVARTLQEAIEVAGVHDCSPIDRSKIYVIGGEMVYEAALPIADSLELTRVDGDFLGDRYFPEVNWSDWTRTREESFEGYSFIDYQRNPGTKR